ncbi:MAG: hypothetical protein AVO33_11490 [delta proteobacterium ML8_F1]|nr:MAG: hypothetical protein AVO33_11490 [delta proteobacterium ML8_F1]
MLPVNNIDYTRIKPYGDTYNDGKIQLSFTLPVPYGEEAKEAGKKLMEKMGIEEPQITHAEEAGTGFTFIVAYGILSHSVDYSAIEVPKVDVDVMDKYGVEDFIQEKIKRDVVIVGATTGFDAHTVGIDAIMNMKGYDGHYGLERYDGIEAVNMGSQVPNEELVAKAVELGADAVIVSQVVTQKDVHIPNLTNLIELIEAEGLRDRMIVIAGGPRIGHELAVELGYDAGFGPGTYAEDVASYVVQEMVKRGLV